MTKATEEFVRQELGDLEDLDVARIIELGASEAEVMEARAWVEGDEDTARALEGPSTGVVARLVAIAQAAAERYDDDRELP
jgi:hypothetical protein